MPPRSALVTAEFNSGASNDSPGTIDDLAQQRLQFDAGAFFVRTSHVGHKFFCLMIGDQVDRRATKAAAG